MNDVIYSNVSSLTRMLNEIDPALKRQLVKDVKGVAKPVQSAVVKAIPDVSPLRQMNVSRGRLSWNNARNYKGTKVKAKSVTVNFKASGARGRNITPLVRIQANHPAVAMLDTARRGRTKQGQQMLRLIGGATRSRYLWPAAESKIPEAQAQVKIILDRAAALVTRRFK